MLDTWWADFDRTALPPTPARVEVYRILKAMDGTQMTADTMFHELSVAGTSIALSSVYAALRDLVRHGLVRRAESTRGKAWFSVTRSDGPAEHAAVCRVCGQSIALDKGRWLAALSAASEAHGLRLSDAPMLVYAVCRACA